MAQILKPENFGPLNIQEKTKLAQDCAAAQAVAVVENAQGFATDNFFLVGRGDQAEIKKIQSISGQNVTAVSNFSFKHNRFDEVLKLRGDQIVVYRATAPATNLPPADNTYSVLTTLTIEADQEYTEHIDSGGSSGYWYKMTYKNSVSGQETDIGDSEPIRGGDFGHFCTIYEIREEAGFVGNDRIPDSMIADSRDDAEDEIKGRLSKRYSMPLTYVPPMVRNITKYLGAAYLLLKSYGIGEEGTNKEGQAKKKMAMEMLEGIEKGEVALLDQAGQPLAQITTTLSGYPDDTAAEADPPEGRKFKITQVF